jgi:hypothetical protein
MAFYISGTKTFIRDNRNFDSSEFDSTGVKLYIFIHNEVRDFDKNSAQPEIRVNRIRDNESQLYFKHKLVLRKFSLEVFHYHACWVIVAYNITFSNCTATSW